MQRVWPILLIVLLMAFWSAPGNAKVFRNSYVSFELPDRWDCQLEQTEYVCRSQAPGQDKREAVIILTAKEAGPADNLQAYEAHLKAPVLLPSASGHTQPSQVIKVETRTIANHPWVDGMHLGSQIPNYYTRYMATVRDNIAMVVTFTAHKKYYSKYANDFIRSIESLRVLTTKDLASGNKGAINPGADIIGASGNTGLPVDLGNDLPDEGSGSAVSNGMMTNILGGAVLLGAIGIYVFLKAKKKK